MVAVLLYIKMKREKSEGEKSRADFEEREIQESVAVILKNEGKN